MYEIQLLAKMIDAQLTVFNEFGVTDCATVNFCDNCPEFSYVDEDGLAYGCYGAGIDCEAYCPETELKCGISRLNIWHNVAPVFYAPELRLSSADQIILDMKALSMLYEEAIIYETNLL